MLDSENSAQRCAFFLQKKKRLCRMTVKPGRKYCGEHAMLENTESEAGATAEALKPGASSTTRFQRVPCPYDPNHSCFVSQLEKHLERCNSKPQPLPEYIQTNVNLVEGNGEEEEIKVVLGNLSDEELLAFISKFEKTHSELVGMLPNSIGHHTVLESTLASLSESRGSWRHVYQTSSILHNMARVGILTSGESSTYVEFGSGRGQLSYALGQAINLETDAMLMIDKSSPRHKQDNRYKVDGVAHASIHRIRADIADVDLGRVPLVRNTRRLVGIGKHLCGAATDLALNCLHRANDRVGLVQGVSIALCCHHQCTWRHYVGKSFFKEAGLNATDFAVIRAMTSWAVCGSGSSRLTREEEHSVPEEAATAALPGRYAALGLDVARRECIGRQCKQIIDRGRVAFLSTWPLQAELVRYVESEISPENVLLLAHS